MEVLKDQGEFFSELIVRVLRSPSPSAGSVVSAISSNRRAQYIDFAVSVLAGLTNVAINELYQKAIALSLQDADGVIQKKAYKAFSIVLKSSDSFVSSKFEELSELMAGIYPPKLFPAKRHRLDCIDFLLVHLSNSVDNLEVMKQENAGCFLSEIILAVKEIARGLREAFSYFISAVVKSLAHLASNFADLVLPAFNCLRRMYLLRPTENREIIKANHGLLKVIVVESQAEWLQMHLRSMVEGLLKWQNNTKNHFKAKAKLLLGMLVTKCGLVAVKAVISEEHTKLLTNIHKIQKRKERKRGAKSAENRSHFLKATFRQKDSRGSDVEYVNVKAISRGGKSSLHLKSAESSLRSNMRLKKNLPAYLSDESEDEPLDLQQGRSEIVRASQKKVKVR